MQEEWVTPDDQPRRPCHQGCGYGRGELDFENHLSQQYTGHLAQWPSPKWVPPRPPEDSCILSKALRSYRRFRSQFASVAELCL